MKKSTKIMIGIIALLLLITLVYFIVIRVPPPKEHIPYYTNEPESWITNKENYEIINKTILNIEKMTKGNSEIDETHQRYLVDGDIQSFYYYGYYKGNIFRTEYLDPIFYNLSYGKPIEEVKKLRDEHRIMKISPEMQPSDNTIEGIIVAREENQKLVFYIFIDKDWENKVKFTNIIWGDNLNNKETLHIKSFDFSNEERGVYIEKIDDDVDWYNLYPHKGGIVVGEMIIDDVVENKIEDKTFMYIR